MQVQHPPVQEVKTLKFLVKERFVLNLRLEKNQHANKILKMKEQRNSLYSKVIIR